MYAKYIKRPLDFILSLTALIVLSPVILILIIVGAIVMKGNPFFIQVRPGKNEKLFKIIKFRTMTCAKDKNGDLLPDDMRLTKYGKFLRDTSADELMELVNIVKNDMSIIGPRPQLVKDLFFMTEEQRNRHNIRPGLTGLAQINGRNNITWEQKFEYDMQYINNGITFLGDIKILFKTVGKVCKRADTVREGTVSDIDLGKWLMNQGEISQDEYNEKEKKAKELLKV